VRVHEFPLQDRQGRADQRGVNRRRGFVVAVVAVVAGVAGVAGMAVFQRHLTGCSRRSLP
jgi:hypothetical protein